MTNSDSSDTLMAFDHHDIRRYVGSSMVTIIVGPNQKKFHVHQDMLTKFSEYFRACLNSGFVESQELVVRLEDVDDAHFEGFVYWSYGENLGKEAVQKDFNSIIFFDLYALADRLLIQDLKNDIIDTYRQYLSLGQKVVVPRGIITLHSRGLLGSPFGSFLVECVARSLEMDSEWRPVERSESGRSAEQGQIDILCEVPEAAAEVLKCLMMNRGRDWTDPVKRRGCVFHEHKDGDKCPAAHFA